jgi:hypothetical protein
MLPSFSWPRQKKQHWPKKWTTRIHPLFLPRRRPPHPLPARAQTAVPTRRAQVAIPAGAIRRVASGLLGAENNDNLLLLPDLVVIARGRVAAVAVPERKVALAVLGQLPHPRKSFVKNILRKHHPDLEKMANVRTVDRHPL